MVAFAHALMRIPAEHRVHIQRALGRMFGIQPLCPNLYASKEMFLDGFVDLIHILAGIEKTHQRFRFKKFVYALLADNFAMVMQALLYM